VGSDGALVTEAHPKTDGAATDFESGGLDRHSIRASEWDSVADAPEGNGLRIGEQLLAALGPLARRGRLATGA
jgi:hypothetical protein